MKRFRFKLLLMAAVPFLSQAVRADDAPADDSSPQALFKRLDANADGLVSAEEIPEEQKRLFERLQRKADKNGDGKLDQAELTEGLKEQPPLAGPGGGNMGRVAGAMRLFQSLDTNGDGSLSADEIAAASESLKKLDRDGNGSISNDEIAPQGPFGGQGLQQYVERLKQADKDGDGKISKDEAPDRLKQNFDRLDRNKDGFIDQQELQQMLAGGRPGGQPGGPGGFAERLKQADKDGDGKISQSEVPEQMKQVFERLDGNKDGFIDQQELQQLGGGRPGGQPGGRGGFAERLKQADKDGDGKISKDEAPDRLKQNFDRLDGNKDGFIDQQELQQMFAGGRPGGQPGGPGGFADRLKQADKDGDGKISQTEVPEPMKPVFERLDGNKDGFLDQQELQQLGGGRPGGQRPGAPGGQDFAGILKRVDKDGDGKLSKEEVPEQFRENFAKADANGDGFLDSQEIRQQFANAAGRIGGGIMQRLRGMDKDGDGKISKDEAPEPLKQQFDTLDTNKDGFLDQQDMRQGFGRRLREFMPRNRNRPQRPAGEAPAEKPVQ